MIPPPIAVRSQADQRNFVDRKFADLTRLFDEHAATLTSSAAGLIPEEVLVIEVRGAINELPKVLARIDGLEFFYDALLRLAEDEADSIEGQQGDRLYLMSANKTALNGLLSSWQRYKRDGSLPRGQAPLRDLFRQLNAVRFWAVQDRVSETHVEQYWREQIELGNQMIPFEVELWYRDEPNLRSAIESHWREQIIASGGEMGTISCIPEIAYHGILAKLPQNEIHAMLDRRELRLLGDSTVMFFDEVGQSLAARFADDDQADGGPPPQTSGFAVGSPIAALLDTLPVANHPLLAGQVTVEDPEEWSAEVPVINRDHGTAMASLIINGDLNEQPAERPARPLLCYPLLRPNGSGDAAFPVDRLPIDALHAAIRNVINTSADRRLKLITLAVGDPNRLFLRIVSKWARLLDWLAYEHSVLFVISAGNPQPNEFVLTADRGSFEALDDATLAAHVAQASHLENRNRRLLAPADSVNALTVGGLYDDASTPAPGAGQRLVFQQRNLPAPYGAQGFGFRQSIKPDIMLPSGRMLYQEKRGTERTCQIAGVHALRAPGQLVALAPRNGRLDASGHFRGTSNAAALATRAGIRAWNIIEELRNDEGYEIDHAYDAVLIKALLAHACSRSEIEHDIEQLDCFPKDQISKIARRLAGYGKLYDDRLATCTSQRATLIGVGSLMKDEAHEYDVPTPSSLGPTTELRRLTITLSYLTPVNVRHHLYRRAVLRAELGALHPELGVRIDETHQHDSARGTLQHLVFAGRDAVAARNGQIKIAINCRAEAGDLDTPIQYALAVTIEADAQSAVPVYQEVRAKVLAAVPRAPVSVPAPTVRRS